MKKFNDYIKEQHEAMDYAENNDFFRKYEDINWVNDGKMFFQKIMNVLSSKYDGLKSDFNDDELDTGSVQFDISNGEAYYSLFWDYDDNNLNAMFHDEGGQVIKSLNDIEAGLREAGVIGDNSYNESKNNKEDMNNIKKFENWMSDRAEMEMRKSGEEIMKKAQEDKEGKCECGKCSKEDCKCGPDCDCEECKEKHGDK